MTGSEKGKQGCLKKIMVGLGCGCVYPAAFALILILSAVYFLSTPIQLIVTYPDLPQIVTPTQEDFWSLQEKRLDNKDEVAANLELTVGEFNAFLSEFQFAPANGIYLQRTRFHIHDNKGVFLLFCSGMFMRNLVFRIEIENNSSDKSMETGDIFINSYRTARSSFANRYATNIMKRLILANEPDIIDNLVKFPDSFTFSGDRVTISTSLMR